jgi:hypothetical protein
MAKDITVGVRFRQKNGAGVDFSVDKLKIGSNVADEDVTITWTLDKDSATSWTSTPPGIVFPSTWPGNQPTFDSTANTYRLAYKNTRDLRGIFKYSINVEYLGISEISSPQKLFFDPEVQNEPPNSDPGNDKPDNPNKPDKPRP